MILDLLFKLLDIKFLLGFINNGVLPRKLEEDEEDKYINDLFNEETHEEARNMLISHNLRLVAHIAQKYESKDENIDDLISIGTIGLVKAVDTYSKDKQVKLATYASKCIENEILMVLRSNKKHSKNVSLYEPIGLDKDGLEIQLHEVLPSSDELLVDEINHNERLNALLKYLNVLDEREMKIISLRFGLNNKTEYTQKEIAKMYNISRSYVSRIEKRALTKMLREYIKNKNESFN